MKFNKKNRLVCATILALAVGFSSCNKFMDVNDTPNNPLVVPPHTLLPSGLAGSAFSNANELNRFASTIMSVTAGAGNNPAAYDIYNTTSADFGNQWRFEIYGGALITFQKLIDATQETSPLYAGISKIMKAYTFALATDTWGDVPYSEALKGDLEQITPRLEVQRDIYLGNNELGIQSLFDLVKEGIADLDKESILTPGSEDLTYGGDIDNWRRAGNTLLLKLALQISSREPEFARGIINEVLQSGNFISSNAENLEVNFGGQVGSQSPIYTYSFVSSFQTDMLMSTRFVDLLNSKDDPRLPIFVTKPNGNFGTIDNGFRGTVMPLAQRSRFNEYITGANGVGPVRLITNWQRAFILAEASVRLGTDGDPQALYQEGLRASMESAGISSLEIDAYFSAHVEEVTLSGTDDQKIEKIITQKYISMIGNGLEQWNDWRRTGYPILAQHQNAVGIDGTRPVRAVYVDQELQRNPNFPQGANLPQSNVKVWWDID